MTLEETIEMLKGIQNEMVDYAELVGAPAFAYGYKYVYPEPEDYAIEEAISALKEIQQYQEIGTVEECREAVEKQKPKKIQYESDYRGCNGFTRYRMGKCPICNEWYNDRDGYNYCKNCGQAIQWDENLEGMKDEQP